MPFWATELADWPSCCLATAGGGRLADMFGDGDDWDDDTPFVWIPGGGGRLILGVGGGGTAATMGAMAAIECSSRKGAT